MTSRDFAYWLQGFFEISEAEQLSQNQVKMIKKHLAMVFIHEIDPSMGDIAHKKKLLETHSPKFNFPQTWNDTFNFPPKFNC